MTAYFLLLFTVIISLIASWWLYRRDENTGEAAAMLQAVLTASALLVAAYWYFIERRGQPHADLTQTISVHHLNDEYAAVEASLSIKNVGTTLLKVRVLEVQLQDMTSTQSDLEKITSVPFNEWPNNIAGKQLYFGLELMWPIIRWFRGVVRNDIEPGETDVIPMSFIVPCTVEVIRLASTIKKGDNEKLEKVPTDSYWNVRSVISTEGACKPRVPEDRQNGN